MRSIDSAMARNKNSNGQSKCSHNTPNTTFFRSNYGSLSNYSGSFISSLTTSMDIVNDKTPLLKSGKGKRYSGRNHDQNDNLKNEFETDVHKIDLEELCTRLKTDPLKGLSDQQVKINGLVHGENVLSPPKKTPSWIIYLKHQLGGFSILLWIGAILCFTAYGVQHMQMQNDVPKDYLYMGIVLVLVVKISGAQAYFQEAKSNDLIKSLKNMNPQTVSVIRNNGTSKTIEATNLVVGDVITLQTGDVTPADIRIVETNGLKLDNSTLTGESEPQAVSTVFTHDRVIESRNLAFYSTFVVEGTGTGVVIGVGDNTYLGRIASLASNLKPKPAPITIEMDHFVRIISSVAIFFGALFFLISILMGYSWLESAVFLIGIIVANVPEGLLATVTACLALTSKRMASKNCVVKHLEAVETLGSTTVICSDKTGTLTTNKMTVSHIWCDGKIINVRSEDPQSTERRRGSGVGFRALSVAGRLCSRAIFAEDLDDFSNTGKKSIIGDASETAILRYMEDIYGDVEEFRMKNTKIFEIPFNSGNKYQLSVHVVPQPGLSENHRQLLVMKGAPEKILSLCSKILVGGKDIDITDEWRKSFDEAYESLGSLGERVIGFCDCWLDSEKYPISHHFSPDKDNLLNENFRFLGLMSMIDPPKSTVPDAVRKCRSAGVKVAMITGDHPITAEAIAKQVGIISSEKKVGRENLKNCGNEYPVSRVIHGNELLKMDENELDHVVRKHSELVFARTSPQQKFQIVESFQRQGEIVAVTGDGVNDSPALKRADIGVAMGIAGCDVAKEASDMLLQDDNFSSIVTGVEEGRLIFDNLKKCVFYTLTDNISELTPFLLFILFQIPLPLGTISILCIDLGTDIVPAISLAYESAESDIMKRPPRDPKKDKLVTQQLISYAYGQIGIIQSCAGLFTYVVIMAQNGFLPNQLLGLRHRWDSPAINDLEDSFGQEWTFSQRKKLECTCSTAYFVSIVVCQWANLLISKTRRVSVIKKGMSNWVLNFALVFETAVACFLCYTPGMDVALKMMPLKFQWWLLALPFSFLIFGYDELRRYFIRNFKGGWFQKEFYY